MIFYLSSNMQTFTRTFTRSRLCGDRIKMRLTKPPQNSECTFASPPDIRNSTQTGQMPGRMRICAECAPCVAASHGASPRNGSCCRPRAHHGAWASQGYAAPGVKELRAETNPASNATTLRRASPDNVSREHLLRMSQGKLHSSNGQGGGPMDSPHCQV